MPTQVKVGWRSFVSPVTSSYLLDSYSSAAAAYSLRKLRTAYTGNAIRVRRSSDNGEQNIGFDANGNLDTTTLLSFVGAGNGFVTTWYDQSGNTNLDAVQTSAVNQPYIVQSGVLCTLNGKAIIRNPNANVIRCLITPISSAQTRPISIIASGKIYSLPLNGYGNVGFYLGGTVNAGAGSTYAFNVTPSSFGTQIRYGSTTVNTINTYNTYSSFIHQGHFASSVLTSRINGIDATTTITDSAPFAANSNFTLIGANAVTTDFIPNIGMYEYIFYFSDKTSDRAGIESNINSYYSIYASDVDAQAFVTAAGITDGTQISAVNTLVTSLKSANIWTKMKALYPFVGGSAASHKFNLKDPRDLDAAYRLVFNGGWTHTSTGAKPNGTTGYADTKLIPSSILTASNLHISYYSRTDSVLSGMIGLQDDTVNNASQIYLAADKTTDYYSAINTDTNRILVSSTNTTGYYIASRLTSTNLKAYKNGSQVGSNIQISSGYRANISVYLGGFNYKNQYSVFTIDYGNKESAFASIGDGLSDTEAANFYTAIQTYQSTLGRQVGIPIVADTDAQAFLNAAVITDSTQASAVNTLVTDLKSANIWTKMKALYPFVGGTANSHKFNLKDPRDLDAAYRLVFNGGWVHSSTGALPNGTTAYANTYLAPNAMGQNNVHVSFYSRTNADGLYADIGGGAGISYVEVLTKYTGRGYVYVNTHQGDWFYNPSSTGLYIANRIVAGAASLFKNNTKVINSNRAAQTPTTYNLYLAAENGAGTAGNYSPREQAFATIGDGLTDVEAEAFYNAVQAFQTSLGRQV